MADLSITKSYADSTSVSLTKADLDNFKTDLEAFFLKATSGITEAHFKRNSIDGATKIKDATIDTSQITDANVDEGHMVHTPQVLSSVCAAATSLNNATALVDVEGTAISATVTTKGRPVMVMLVPDGSSTAANLFTSNGLAGLDMVIKRDTTEIARVNMGSSKTNGIMPCGYVNTIDIVSAGTYVYTLEGGVAQDTGESLTAIKILAMELW